MYAQGRWSVQQQQQQPRRSTVRVVYRGKGGCTGHCCINRFGELGVATPEGTAHVRIDYTHLFPAFNSLSLPLSFALILFHPLTSRASSRFSAIGGWLRFSLSYNTSFSLFLSLRRSFCSSPFVSLSLSFTHIVLYLLFFSSAFSLSALPSDHPCAPDERFLPVVPTGHAARLFSSHLLCKRTQSRPTTPARCTLSRRRRLPRNLQPPRTQPPSHACARMLGLNIQTLAACLFFFR